MRRGGRDSSTEALILYLREREDELVRGEGEARFVGDGSIGSFSIGEAAVEAFRWALRQERQRFVCGGPAHIRFCIRGYHECLLDRNANLCKASCPRDIMAQSW